MDVLCRTNHVFLLKSSSVSIVMFPDFRVTVNCGTVQVQLSVMHNCDTNMYKFILKV